MYSMYSKALAVCLIGGMFVGFQFMLQGTPGVMVPSLQNSFHISLPQVGVLSSSMLYFYVLFQGVGGYLGYRYGERNCLVMALSVLCVLCILFSITKNYESALTVRLLMGICSIPGVFCTIMLINRWFPCRLFALIAGIWEAMNMGLTALVPAVIAPVVIHDGWRFSMLVVAGIGVFILLLIIAFVRDFPDEEAKNSHQQMKNNRRHEKDRNKAGLWALSTNVTFLCCCLFCFGLFSIVSVFASLWAVPFVKVMYPRHQLFAVQTISFIFIGTAIGAPVTGALTSYFNKSRPVMVGCVMLSLVCMSLLLYIKIPIHIVSIVMFFLGLSSSVYMLPFSLIRNLFPSSWYYTANALLNGICLAATPILQPLVGGLLSMHAHHATLLKVGDFRFSLLPIYLLLWASFVSLIWIKEKC